MEIPLQFRLQRSLNHHLCHPIRHRRYPQRPASTIRLGNLHKTHRWRHIAARGHAIPQLVEIASKPCLEILYALAIATRCPLSGSHLLIALPDPPFGDLKWLCLVRRIFPHVGCHSVQGSMTWPLRSTTITVASPLLRATPPLRLASVLWALWWSPLGRLPSHRGKQVPTFHTQAWSTVTPPLHRMPSGPSSGTCRTRPGPLTWPRFRHHLELFDASSAVHSRSSQYSTPDRSCLPFPPTLTTTTLDRSSLGWFDTSS